MANSKELLEQEALELISSLKQLPKNSESYDTMLEYTERVQRLLDRSEETIKVKELKKEIKELRRLNEELRIKADQDRGLASDRAWRLELIKIVTGVLMFIGGMEWERLHVYCSKTWQNVRSFIKW